MVGTAPAAGCVNSRADRRRARSEAVAKERTEKTARPLEAVVSSGGVGERSETHRQEEALRHRVVGCAHPTY